ncbi:hypothetical protein M1O17_03970 [Dehalococcoidia bacterium]|nr:hypothetical protein [Dehalococcoidia bacterium]MCL0076005.1 hypothetical protein [Dehalococcoidia bacterium]MCL0102877.1 hypothetical protein [Dehalococcoidia bacterium]
MSEERKTAKYHLMKGNKIIHRGIIDRPLEERKGEHQERFPASHIVQIGRRTTREKALEWERKGGKR